MNGKAFDNWQKIAKEKMFKLAFQNNFRHSHFVHNF